MDEEYTEGEVAEDSPELFSIQQAIQRGITPEESVEKLIELEVSEDKHFERFKEVLGEDDKFGKALKAFLPTRDIAHGNTTPLDEFKVMSDYEIALHLLNLGQRGEKNSFAKAAVFFYMMGIANVTSTKSRGGFFVENLRTFWTGKKGGDEDKKKKQVFDPRNWVGR